MYIYHIILYIYVYIYILYTHTYTYVRIYHVGFNVDIVVPVVCIPMGPTSVEMGQNQGPAHETRVALSMKQFTVGANKNGGLMVV